MSLSAEQRRAVERTGQDVCCVAGPGSGKTRVLVERFAWLIGDGMDPARILAITFTDKAATEIKRRLAERFAGQGELRERIEHAPVSTVHGFCAVLLREHALDAGLDPGFRVLDELEAETLRIESADAVLDEWAIGRTREFRELVDAWACENPAAHLRAVHEALRKGGDVGEQLRGMGDFDEEVALEALAAEARELTEIAERNTENRRTKIEAVEAWLGCRREMEPLAWVLALSLNRQGLDKGASAQGQRVMAAKEEALAVLAGSMHQPQREVLRALLLEYDAEYQRRKAAEAAVDFHDLEARTLALLGRDGPAPREIVERYDAILMDELQDTNPVQWRILDRLRRPERFFAVGDLNQSIYGFRHAEPGLFQSYQEKLEAEGREIDRLETNYRSRPGILSFASAVAERSAGVRPHQLIPREAPFAPKSMPVVEIQRFQADPDAGEGASGSEAKWIAYRLEELKRVLQVGDPPRPARWKDMAVLARTKALFGELEAEFAARGIPCAVRRGRNFFDEQEVVDFTNLLRYLASPLDEIALYAVLRSPFFGIADQEIFREKREGRFPPAAAGPVLERLLAARESEPPDRILARFLDERGYLQGCPARVRANAAKFLGLLRTWHSAAPGQWRKWLADLDALRASGDETNAPVLDDEDAVAVMSIHQSKGLEFPVVVAAFLHKGPANDKDPLGWSAGLGLGAAWRMAGVKDGRVPDAILTAIRRRKQEREDLESHRLLYVAMTRAEEHLILSWTQAGKRGTPPWVQLVEGAAGLTWPDAAGTPWLHGGARVSLLTGAPPAPAVGEEVAGGVAAEEVVEIVPAAAVPEAAPLVGVTALVHFAECPRRHFLGNVSGWPDLREGELSTGARELGDAVHRLLGGLPVENPPAEALALRDGFLESPLGREMSAARRVEREFDFLFHSEGTLLRGVIDLWFMEAGGVTLVDYKTGRSIGEATMEAYSDQLRYYALALEALTGRLPRRACLYLLHQGRTVEVALGGETRERCRAVLGEWKRAQEENEWPPRPGVQCEWCSFEGGACPGRALLDPL